MTLHTGERQTTGTGAGAGGGGLLLPAPVEVSAGYAWRERPILMSGPMVRPTLADLKRQTRRLATRLKVRLRRKVSSDMPVEVGTPIIALPGTYAATLNNNGAVTAIVSGQPLGLKPGEFDFVCPYADGETRLVDYGGGRKGWAITPSTSTSQRMWVREAWATGEIDDDMAPLGLPQDATVFYLADGIVRGTPDRPGRGRPGIHMPRWASRITLEVVDVRLQRLQDISKDDAIAEGLKALTKDGKVLKYGIPDRDGLPGNDDDGWPWQDWDTDPRRAFAKLWDRINAERAPWSTNPWAWAVSFRRLTP